jgi:hypothetical protein
MPADLPEYSRGAHHPPARLASALRFPSRRCEEVFLLLCASVEARLELCRQRLIAVVRGLGQQASPPCQCARNRRGYAW